MTKAPYTRSKKSHHRLKRQRTRDARSARKRKVQKEIDQEAISDAIDELIERLKTCDGHEECKSGGGSGSTRSGRSRKKRTRL